MTLNRGDKLRYLDKRRGSMPFSVHQHLHRRSMPVDERDLRAALPPGELSGLVRCTSYSPGQAHRESWASDSSDSVISSGSDSDGHLYKVILLGEHGVGKTSLARIFGGVEDGAEAEEAGEGAGRAGAAPAGWGEEGPAAPGRLSGSPDGHRTPPGRRRGRRGVTALSCAFPQGTRTTDRSWWTEKKRLSWCSIYGSRYLQISDITPLELRQGLALKKKKVEMEQLCLPLSSVRSVTRERGEFTLLLFSPAINFS